MGFSGGSDSKGTACNVGDLGSIPGWGRSLGISYRVESYNICPSVTGLFHHVFSIHPCCSICLNVFLRLNNIPLYVCIHHNLSTNGHVDCFHLFGRASVWSGLFLSVAFKFFSFLGWEPGGERSNDLSLPLALPASLVLLKGSSWEHSAGPRGRAAALK